MSAGRVSRVYGVDRTRLPTVYARWRREGGVGGRNGYRIKDPATVSVFI